MDEKDQDFINNYIENQKKIHAEYISQSKKEFENLIRRLKNKLKTIKEIKLDRRELRKIIVECGKIAIEIETEKVKNSPLGYYVYIDESTDISLINHMIVCISYVEGIFGFSTIEQKFCVQLCIHICISTHGTLCMYVICVLIFMNISTHICMDILYIYCTYI